MPTKSRNRRSPKKLARRMSSKTTRHLSRRKGSARARNPKKLRGGVTTRRRLSQLRQQELSTALRLLPADVVKQIGKRHPLLIPPFTNDALRRAVKDYLAGGARKEDIVKKYGEINNWDVSKVTDMSHMFKDSFNQPLNKWNVSKVTNMRGMFWTCRSFNQPLNNWNVSSLSWHDNEVFFDFNGYMASSTNMESMFQGAISFVVFDSQKFQFKNKF